MNQVLLAGIPSEPPLAMVANALSSLQVPFAVFNQRQFVNTEIDFDFSGYGAWGLFIHPEGEPTYLHELTGFYTRMTDWHTLPEYMILEEEDAAAVHCRQLHNRIESWQEATHVKVVNPTHAMSSNISKSYQVQLIADYFPVPDSIVTNDPEYVARFVQEHSRIIYKSTSSERSIVTELDERAIERLDYLPNCPVLFQEYIGGQDIRVHVIGNTVFPTLVESNGTDYRYSQARLMATSLPDAVTERCIELSRSLDLHFSGIDLRLTSEGEYFCFEVNPSPGYSYYEYHTKQPISLELAKYLAGMTS